MATLIRDWIEQAAACHGADLYLADARGPAALSYAGLLGTATDVERRLDAAGLAPGARIVVRLGEPLEYAAALVAIKRPAGWRCRLTRPRPTPTSPGCSASPGRPPSSTGWTSRPVPISPA